VAEKNRGQVMIDMLDNAKQLISKGKILGDPELVQMGMDLLEQYSPKDDPSVSGGYTEPQQPKENITFEDQYICSNCGHEMPVDKEGRKRCPECKKHKLELVKANNFVDVPEGKESAILDYFEKQNKTASTQQYDEFFTQVRDRDAQRLHYDDEGNPDGLIRRREEVDPKQIRNEWVDNKTEEIDDPVNEILKKYTKRTPRTRASVQMVDVKCDRCGRHERLHPIHVRGRSRYVCARCVSKGAPA
jgi:DNA-directed RNA polymerase subunit RPC12/RpoP